MGPADRSRAQRHEVAAALREIGTRLRSSGGRSFSGRAYLDAARSLQSLDLDLERLTRENRLREIQGVGPAIARDIEQLTREGRCDRLDRLREELPSAVLEMAKVPGLGPKSTRLIVEQAGLRSIPELERACLEGRVRELPSFGPAKERRILEGIERYREQSAAVAAVTVRELAHGLAEHLRGDPGVARAEVAGELRRWAAAVSEIVVVAAAEPPERAVDSLARHPLVARVEHRDHRSATLRLATGARVRLVSAPRRRFGWAWIEATGPDAHVAELRERARRRNVDLEALDAATEERVYSALGLPPIPAEARGLELERASCGDLIELADVRGLVHCHSDWSDGRQSIEELARAAEARAFAYLTITDHSRSAHYAGGLTIERLAEQKREIDEVQEGVGLRLLAGSEVDILRDGTLDYPDEVLDRLDVVIASLHSHLRLDADAQTERLIRAVRHPRFKILGHPFARIVQHRPPIAVRFEEVLDAAVGAPVAIEINGDPHRLDLPAEWIPAVRERGIPLVISTDAHSVRTFAHLEWAVGTARRGGAGRGEVLNTRGAEQFARAVAASR